MIVLYNYIQKAIIWHGVGQSVGLNKLSGETDTYYYLDIQTPTGSL